MIVVTTPPLAVSDEELMIEVEVLTLFTVEVRVFTAERSELLSIKLALVVAIFPLTTLVSTKEFVEVEI